jgi:hypothetical protein
MRGFRMIQAGPQGTTTGLEAADGGHLFRWRRDHPAFVPLSGFFSGLAFMLLVPGLFAALLESVLSQHTATDVLPFLLAMFIVPTALLVRERTRRLGLYFLLGMGTSAAVVLGVGALTLWVMIGR